MDRSRRIAGGADLGGRLALVEDEVLAAVEVCGTVVTDLVAGRGPEAKAGRLDDSADLFDKMPGLRDSFVRQAGLVPSGLLWATPG